MSKLKAVIITVLNTRGDMEFQALFSAVQEMAKTEKVEIEIGKEKFSVALNELQENQLIDSDVVEGNKIILRITEKGTRLVEEETAKAEETRRVTGMDIEESEVEGGPSDAIGFYT